MTNTIQIDGMDELIEAIGGGGGGGSIVPTPTAQDEGKVLTAGNDGTASWEDAEGGIPTPTLSDEGKVLQAVPQTQTTVAPEWTTIRELPTGGSAGQVLTRSHEGYEWETPNVLPALYDEDTGKVLMAQYDSDTESTYPAWGIVKGVPNSSASDNGKVLTCTGRNAYGWAPASGGGGGNIDVIKISVSKSDFTQDGSNYVASILPPTGISSKIDKLIGITIVDTSDPGYPSITTPHSNDECAISYASSDFNITINSTIYAALGSREPSIFYLTYYTGA